MAKTRKDNHRTKYIGSAILNHKYEDTVLILLFLNEIRLFNALNKNYEAS